MSEVKVITFLIRQEEFSFLGIQNVVTKNSDFSYFWDNFFKVGGYEKIHPYATDRNPLNVWFTNASGKEIYFQGLPVENAGKIPDGYSLSKFPSCEYLVATTEYLPTHGESMRHINHNYYKNAKIPDGYVKHDGSDHKITLIEKETYDPQNGYRYEFWVPLKKINKQ